MMRKALLALLLLAPAIGCQSLGECLALPETQAALSAIAEKAANDAAAKAADKLEIEDVAVRDELQAAARNAAKQAINEGVAVIGAQGEELKGQVASIVAGGISTITGVLNAAGDATGNPLPKLLALLLAVAGGALGLDEMKKRKNGGAIPPVPPTGGVS